MSKKIDKIFDILKTMAEDVSPVRSAKLTAAIVIKNRIISFGQNSYKSHPFQLEYGANSQSICLHAEVDAIKNALKRVDVDDLKRAKLFVARIKYSEADRFGKRHFVTGLAKPCLGCQRAISTFNIKEVYYTSDDNKIECL